MILFGDIAALVTKTVSAAFRVGIQLSAPFLVFGFLFNIGLGVLSRLMKATRISRLVSGACVNSACESA